MTETDLPIVSIIIPCRNEVEFIEKTLRSILENDYPADKLEVLVVDGMSTDGTREVLKKFCTGDGRVSLLDNSKRIVPTALNIGIINAKGKIIIPVSGHAFIAKDFIKESVYQLRTHPEAWCAGGSVRTVGRTYVGKAIAAAMSSPVGVGNAMWRRGNYEGFVDTLAFGAYWRWAFDKIGLFDETLVRNQDDDFNFRLILSGGKLFMSHKISSKYYARGSLYNVWRQYFQYGFWRTRTLQKHGKPATLRQIAPLFLISFLLILALAGFISRSFWWILSFTLLIYCLGLVYGSIQVAKQVRWKYCLLAPIVFVLLHFGYGFGCMWGIVRFILLRGWGMRRVDEFKLSR
jgi:glycosyltransferase involved in cell wall biosynthesis